MLKEEERGRDSRGKNINDRGKGRTITGWENIKIGRKGNLARKSRLSKQEIHNEKKRKSDYIAEISNISQSNYVPIENLYLHYASFTFFPLLYIAENTLILRPEGTQPSISSHTQEAIRAKEKITTTLKY